VRKAKSKLPVRDPPAGSRGLSSRLTSARHKWYLKPVERFAFPVSLTIGEVQRRDAGAPGESGKGRREHTLEKRRSKRVTVEGNLSGRMVLAADLDIRDLSLSGVCFSCCERVAPGSKVQLLIHKESMSVRMECTVVRSSLSDGQSGSSPGGPVYEVGATFGRVDDEAKGRLERIMDLLGKAN